MGSVWPISKFFSIFSIFFNLTGPLTSNSILIIFSLLFQAELKRLYTQLQIYKTKTMRKDNPHISKRRGGRKQTHRRFSLQPFHHKHRHHHHDDHDHEMSKTPEESTNSAEGVAISMAEESSVGCERESRTPTVTFKPGHKSLY